MNLLRFFYILYSFREDRKKVCFSVLVTMHSVWQWTIYTIIRIIFLYTLTERIGKENGTEKEKNDRGQRRWVSGAFARKPNRLLRDCGAMANSWLRAVGKIDANTLSIRDVLSILPFSHHMTFVSTPSLLLFTSSPHLRKINDEKNKHSVTKKRFTKSQNLCSCHQ